MEQVARAKYLRQSSSKLNRMLAEVRGKDVNLALNILHFAPTKSSVFIEKTLRAAIANIMNSEAAKEVDIDNLYIKRAFADGGPSFKRWRPRAQGRATRILKRTSHLTVIVAEKGT